MAKAENHRWRNALALIGLVAISHYPFVNFLYENRDDYVETGWLLIYASATALVVVLLSAILAFLARRPVSDVAQPMMVLVFCFFSFHPYDRVVSGMLTANAALLAVWVALVGAVCWIVWRQAWRPRLLQFIAILSLLLALQPALGYLAHGVTGDAEARSTEHEEARSKPFAVDRNVYVFLIDTYARADVLEKVFDFDNAPFLNALRDRAFFVADESTVNYPWTSLSIPSMLEMNYLDSEDTKEMLRGDNATVRRFKAAGYRYVLGPAGIWQKVVCGGEEDLCIGKSSPLEMERALLQMTPLHRLPMPESMERYSRRQPEDFLEPDDVSRRIADLPQPSFTFVHFGNVHDQIYGDDCGYRNPSSPRIHNQRKLDGFVASTRCMNDLMLPMLDAIVERDPEAIIVLQSDHGPSIGLHLSEEEKKRPPPNWDIVTRQDFDNKFGVLTAIRAPSSCRDGMADDISAVNVMRTVVACLEGRPPDLLDTKHYFLTRLTPLERIFADRLPPS